MSCYSVDLRQKIVTAYKLGKGSIRQLAAQFMISPTTVSGYIKQDRENHDLTPKKPGPKCPGKLESYRDFIIQMVKDYPDWTLRQYKEYLSEKQGISVSVGTLCEFLKKEQLTLKKKPIDQKKWQQKQVNKTGLIIGNVFEIYLRKR